MAFNTSYSAEEQFLVNPQDLRFTQLDIKSTFKDPTYPAVRETASLLRDGQFSPDDFGPLHVSVDEDGNIWSDNNRRLFAFKEASVDHVPVVVPVVFDGIRIPKNSLKGKLSDPNFMPRIRGEASRVQIPPTPTSFGWNGYRRQKEPEPSHPGSVSAGYWNMQPYNSHEDDEEEDELGASFSQLAIKSTSTYPTHRVPASSKQWGEGNPAGFKQSRVISNFDPNEFGNPNGRLYEQKEGGDDYAPVGSYGNRSGMSAVESKRNDSAYMPRISGRRSGLRNPSPPNSAYMARISGRRSGVRNPPPPTFGGNGHQMEKETFLLGSVSGGYSKRDMYNGPEENEVEYKYWYKGEEVEVDRGYSVPYEDDGEVRGEAKDDESPFGYEDEGKYGYPFPHEDEGNVERVVETENPGHPFQHEEEGEVESHYIPTVFCEDDFNWSVAYDVEDDAAYIRTVFSEDDFEYRHSAYDYD